MANNEIRIRISAENQELIARVREAALSLQQLGGQANQAMNQVGRSAGQANRAMNQIGQTSIPIESLSTKLAKMGSIITGAYAAMKMMGETIKAVVLPVFEYSSAIEQNSIAFETFLGNANLAKQYLGDLEKIAADTPFDLPGVTTAAKKLLAFGFSAKQSLSMLTTIGDAAAGMGSGAEGISRITTALGQMKAKGKVYTEEILQLTEAGIPAYTILSEKLGLTADEIANIGRTGIDANTAINALLEGMNDKFGGIAAKLADTKQGMLTTIQSNYMAITTFILRPLDAALVEGLKKVRDWTNEVAAAIRAGDTQAVYKALFPEELIPAEWKEKIDDISKDLKKMYQEASALANEFGDSGKDALFGIVDAVLDLIDDVINLSRAFIRVGNDLLYIVRSVVPEGMRNFVDMRSLIELAIKSLVGFFVLNKIIALVKGLRLAYRGLQAMIITTSGTSRLFMTSMMTGIRGATLSMGTLKGAVRALGLAFKALSKSNIILFLLSIGVAVFGDKIMDLIDKYMGNNKDNIEEEIIEPPPEREPYPEEDPNKIREDANKKYYQEQSKMLNRAVQNIKQYYESLLGKKEYELKNANDTYDSSGNISEQSQKIEQIKYNIAEIRYAQAQEIYKATQNTAFEDSEDKALKLGAVSNDLERFKRELDDAATSLQGISKIGKNLDNAGQEVINVAKSMLGTPYGTSNGAMVCTQYVKAAWEQAGIALAGEWSDWVPTMVAQAKERGLWKAADSGYIPKAGDAVVIAGSKDAGDEKYSHVGVADGKGGMYDSSSSQQKAVYRKSIVSTFGDDVGGYIAIANSYAQGSKQIVANLKKYQADFKKIISDGLKITAELAGATGDISTAQKEEIINEYDEKIKKFTENGLMNFANATEQLQKLKLSQIDFSQITKNIELAYRKATDEQKKGLDNLAIGVGSAVDVTNEAAKLYEESVRKEREKLQSMLSIAKTNNWTDFANKIADELEKLNDNIVSFYKAATTKIEEKLNQDLALISSNPNFTTLQKRELSDSAKRGFYEEDLIIKREERETLLKNPILNEGLIQDADFKIKELENQLESLGSTLDRVGFASKQAFEDGLLDFLERGIFECESLGDALRELAITVLQSIQKIFAEDLTKNIMVSLGMGPKIEEKDGQLNGGNILGQFGVITGNTNNFLASFNMQMNQFNMITQRAFQSIINTVNKAKGAVSSAGGGMRNGGLNSFSDFSYNSPYFGNMGGFDSMGSTGSSEDWRASLYSGLFSGLLSLLSGGGFAEGGSINKVNSNGLISGAGTGTSDSIFMWVDNLRKMIRVSDAEWVMKEKAVNYYGPNIMAAINNGLIPKEVFSAHQKFSQGGSIRGALPPTGANGAYGLTTEFANNFSPSTKVNVNISERSLMGALNQAIEAKTKTFMKKEMQNNAKLNSMLLKRVW